MRQEGASAKLTPIRIAEAPLDCSDTGIHRRSTERPPGLAHAPGANEQAGLDAEAIELAGARRCVPRKAARSEFE